MLRANVWKISRFYDFKLIPFRHITQNYRTWILLVIKIIIFLIKTIIRHGILPPPTSSKMLHICVHVNKNVKNVMWPKLKNLTWLSKTNVIFGFSASNRRKSAKKRRQHICSWPMLSSATVLSMPLMKRTSSHSTTSYLSLCGLFQKSNVLIISGDMNAQIGKDESTKFCLHNSSNRNGDHLTELSHKNRLSYLNTKFQKKEEKLWTYIYLNNTKAQRLHIHK